MYTEEESEWTDQGQSTGSYSEGAEGQQGGDHQPTKMKRSQQQATDECQGIDHDAQLSLPRAL